MPTQIKVIFSIVVLAFALGGYYFLNWFSGSVGVASYLALFLGVFSVVAFWIFPEVTNKK